MNLFHLVKVKQDIAHLPFLLSWRHVELFTALGTFPVTVPFVWAKVVCCTAVGALKMADLHGDSQPFGVIARSDKGGINPSRTPQLSFTWLLMFISCCALLRVHQITTRIASRVCAGKRGFLLFLPFKRQRQHGNVVFAA